jgi:hypothetical protein
MDTSRWQRENQRYLVERLAVLRWMLEHPAGFGIGIGIEQVNGAPAPEITPWPLDEPPALDTLAATFGLSAFEQEIVLLCAGMELDARIGPLCATALAETAGRPWPTFSLALATFPDPHWSAMTPASPLRYWDLVSLATEQSLTLDRLTINERILHYLAGVSYLDERLSGLIQNPPPAFPSLTGAHAGSLPTSASLWDHVGVGPRCLHGSDIESRRDVALASCAARGLGLLVMSAASIPFDPQQRDKLVRLWDREAALMGVALLIECDTIDHADLPRWDAVRAFAEQTHSTVLLSVQERRHAALLRFEPVEVPLPTSAEQSSRWQQSMNGCRLSGEFTQTLVSQFSLSARAIGRIAASIMAAEGVHANIEHSIWDACRKRSRHLMPALAQRLVSNARWDDLILPDQQMDVLKEVAAHVRQRTRVYEEWGFAGRHSRGLGISLLCTGPSGTGKTLAAEVLANELQLDLYRIELSEVISKYIGETEKNLGQVFAAAEACGAMLLFDEAESVFGKRTDVRDSHDRYANIEVAYLLQRMESFRGLSILTTNLKDALDGAFLRRIRFVVQFPYPDLDDRARIWQQVLPAQTPTRSLDYTRLARLNLSGGLIRNVAMNAAFLAAEDDEAVSMRHLAIAARREHAKQGKPVSEHEIGGWA